MPAKASLPAGVDKRPCQGHALFDNRGLWLRYLNTVYVRNHRARVRSRRGALLVASPDGSQRIPLEAVDAVVLLGGGQITTQALEACVRRGVRVAALRQGGSVRFVVGHPTGGNIHLRMALYRVVNDEQLSLGSLQGHRCGQASEQPKSGCPLGSGRGRSGTSPKTSVIRRRPLLKSTGKAYPNCS